MPSPPEGFRYEPGFLTADGIRQLTERVEGLEYQHDSFRGQRLRHYAEVERVLMQEYGTTPGPSTRSLIREIKRWSVPGGAAQSRREAPWPPVALPARPVLQLLRTAGPRRPGDSVLGYVSLPDPTEKNPIVFVVAETDFGPRLPANELEAVAAQLVEVPAPPDGGMRVRSGDWSLADGELRLNRAGDNPDVIFGSPYWRDYDLTVEAQRTGGPEGFAILFRVVNGSNYYKWNLDFSGHLEAVEKAAAPGTTRSVVASPTGRLEIEVGRWYTVKIECRGDRFTCFLDGKKVREWQDGTHPRGGVGVGAQLGVARFRNLRITDPAGRVICAPDLRAAKLR